MGQTVVVTGARGVVGRCVVSALIRDGAKVRAVSRQPERASLPSAVEVRPGDLADPPSLARALADADTLVLVAVPDTAREVVAVAARAGIGRIVVVSSGAVTAGYDTTYHLPVEQAVRESGVGWAIVRPGEFAMNSLLIWGPSIRESRQVIEPFPDQAGNPIHECDVADAIVADCLDPDRQGRIDTIVGPDTLTKRQQVEAISAAIGADLRLEQVTPDQAREFYRRQGGFAAANADFLFGFESYDGVPDTADEPHDTNVDPAGPYVTIAETIGRPARSYAAWARDHAAEFS